MPLEADAADEQAIINVCERAMREEGRLDIFFANAGIVGANMLPTTDPEEYVLWSPSFSHCADQLAQLHGDFTRQHAQVRRYSWS